MINEFLFFDFCTYVEIIDMISVSKNIELNFEIFTKNLAFLFWKNRF